MWSTCSPSIDGPTRVGGMGRLWRGGGACALAALAISACSSTSKPEHPSARRQDESIQPCRYASDVRYSRFGRCPQGHSSDPVIESYGDGPWLTVTVLADNGSQGVIQAPQFELRCSGSSAARTWPATSTFKPGDPIPSGSSKDGTVRLVIPREDRLGGPRPLCAAPATVVASLLVFDDSGASAPVQKRLVWPVPDKLVGQLNAAPIMDLPAPPRDRQSHLRHGWRRR